MKEIVGVRFKANGKTYYYDPNSMFLKLGTHVIVDTVLGDEYGEVVISNRNVEDELISEPLKKVIRIVSYKEEKIRQEFKEKEKSAFDLCQEQIDKYELPMKLVEAEYKYDGTRLTFYFTADTRIDFRELVKSLATIFKTRIEMRQISARDEVKLIGGNGICGRELCCCSFLNSGDAITIKMIKEQNLPLNINKNSGVCGRLKCCLKYEHDVYCEKLKVIPPVGSKVKTKDGIGFVDSIEILKEDIRVKFIENNETYYKKYNINDVVVLKRPKNNEQENNEDDNINE